MKSKTKILFGTSETGGAECLVPLFFYLKDKEYDIHVVSSEHAKHIFEQHKIDYELIPKTKIKKSCENLITIFQPDLIINSFGGPPNNIDYNLIHLAHQQGIPSISILDSWMRIDERIHKLNNFKRILSSPNHIFTLIDEMTLEDWKSTKASHEQCVLIGHPKFDTYKNIIRKRNNPEYVVALKEKYNISRDNHTITFFSQPLDKLYPNRSLGYNEFDCLDIISNVYKILKKSHPIHLLIKDHPRHPSLKDIFFNKNHYYIFEHPDDFFVISDIIIGMNTTQLIHAHHMGLPIINLQPNIIIENDLNILTQKKKYPIIKDSIQLKKVITDFIYNTNKKQPSKSKWLDGQCSKRIEEIITNYFNL